MEFCIYLLKMFIEIVCAQSGTFVTWMCMTVCKYFYSPTY